MESDEESDFSGLESGLLADVWINGSKILIFLINLFSEVQSLESL